jgi:hypothetical protein
MKLETLLKYFVMACGIYFIISYLADNPQFFAEAKVLIDNKINSVTR